jgi:2-keto-4-pentenoate hydratase/2-oxohepta-3-ene-1,7-dioic acid hydratase in catechol pathway
LRVPQFHHHEKSEGNTMKLLRHGPAGQEKPGLLDASGTIRDLSSVAGDIDGAVLSDAKLAELARVDTASLPVVDGATRLGSCVAGARMFLAIGLNYRDHAIEAGQPIPTEPILFMKAAASMSGPNDDVPIAPGSVKLDWEVELGVVIGKDCRHVPQERALDHVAGYCVINDVSERAWQMERGGQWVKGKSHDGYGPTGPWLVTRDEVPDPQNLDMFLDVNGTRRQTGNTRTMVFGVAEIIAYVSRFMTLRPGDVIATGTPPGVGLGMKPPQYLAAGDTMHLGIASLGEQRQTVVPSRFGAV